MEIEKNGMEDPGGFQVMMSSEPKKVFAYTW